MKQLWASLLIFASGWLSTSALDVDCQPGKLASLVDKPGSVTALTIRGSINASDFDFAAKEMPALRSLDLSECTIIDGTIPQGAFGASALQSLVLPSDGELTIGNFAFASSELVTVDIPANIVSVGYAAFADCRNLTTVSLAGAALGASAFEDCTTLTSIIGAESIELIGDKAFEGCESLRAFEFGSQVRYIGASAFAGCGISEIEIPSTAPLDSIGAWAFAYNTAISKVSLPQSTQTIGRGAFFGCSSLSKLTLPASCTKIADFAMVGVSALNSLSLPSELRYIGSHAMEGMNRLSTIDGTQLSAVPDLGNDVFVGINQQMVCLNVDERHTDEFKTAEQWKEFSINGVISGADLNKAFATTKLQGGLMGNVIYVESIGLQIDYLELYTIEGLMPVRAKVSAEQFSVDISNLDSKIFIVRCVLADKSIATLKLAR